MADSTTSGPVTFAVTRHATWSGELKKEVIDLLKGQPVSAELLLQALTVQPLVLRAGSEFEDTLGQVEIEAEPSDYCGGCCG